MAVLETWNALKGGDLIVGKEESLQLGTVIDAIYLVYDVASQIELCQAVESVEAVHGFDQIVGEIQNTQLTKMIDVFNFADLVRM